MAWKLRAQSTMSDNRRFSLPQFILYFLIGGILFFSPSLARAQTSVTMERNDNSRTGANLNETILNTSNVNVTQFGKLYSYAVDGSPYAQPLYVPNVVIPGRGTHNVLYVATMNDVMYAFDADSNAVNGGLLWSVDFRNPAAGVTAIPISNIVGQNDLNIVGNVGIESTPAIDLTSNTIYLVARTMEVSGSTTNYVARLHALDITTATRNLVVPLLFRVPCLVLDREAQRCVLALTLLFNSNDQALSWSTAWWSFPGDPTKTSSIGTDGCWRIMLRHFNRPASTARLRMD